jgi:predicted RNA-binding protein Jag
MNTYVITENFIKDLIKSVFGIEVAVTISTDPRGLTCEVSPLKLEDKGLLIGYKGENCDAIRRLARIWGKRNNIALHVFIKFDYQ